MNKFYERLFDELITNYSHYLVIFVLIIAILELFKFLRKKYNQKLVKQVTSLNRGVKSELDVILSLLKARVDPNTIYHDLVVTKDDGKTAQIDLVLLSKVGLIVIEVKDYKGYIYGSGNDQKWTQTLAYGRKKRKYHFYNPLHQNQGHISALKGHFSNYSDLPFYNVVIFAGSCSLKELEFIPKGSFVGKINRVMDIITQIVNDNSEYSYINREDVADKLRSFVDNAGEDGVEQKHIDQVKDMLGTDRVFR